MNEVMTNWQVPTYQKNEFSEKAQDYCVVIPVINEGERIKSLLTRMKALDIAGTADIIIVDGGTTDGSLEHEFLRSVQVRTLLEKTGAGKLSAQLRCAYAYAMEQGYDGVVTIDGNDKDDPDEIPDFVTAMKQGVDFVQGSRYVPGGKAVNTPWVRDLAIRIIHAPALSISSGMRWTDTTQGFRGYSRKLLTSDRLAIFRDIFSTYELLAYLSAYAPRLGLVCKEIPTTRRYPKGEVPTKISAFKGNLDLIKVLWLACTGAYKPRS